MSSDLAAILAAATPGPWTAGSHGTAEVQTVAGVLLADCGTLDRARADARLMSLAPTLAAEVLALRAEVARLDAGATGLYFSTAAAEDRAYEAGRECDRLRRILTVERGDQSAAPEGWRRNHDTWSTWDDSFVHRIEAGRWDWVARRGAAVLGRGTAPTALEAMEAADRAAKEIPNE